MAGTSILIGVLVLGGFLAAIGVILIPVVNKIINNMVVNQIVLKNGTTGYENWVTAPVPLYVQYWVWDCVNPSEVLNGEKPYLFQKGPYTYREYWPKKNITFGANHSISFTAPKSYVFERSMSVGDPKEDTFTTINIPLITIINLMKDESGFLQFLEALLVAGLGSETFIRLSVHDILWGYTDKLLSLAYSFKFMPSPIFGLYVGKNGTADGEYVIQSGEGEVKNVNKILTYQGSASLSFWSDKYANMINGTDGSMNPPFLKKDDYLWLFSSDICRSAYLQFDSEYEYEKITLYRYVIPPMVYANVSTNPNNKGFCTPTPANCLPGGLMNGSNCQHDAPVVFSLPHFLYADKEVFDMVGGMQPNKEEHQILFDAEPLTGASFSVAKRIQINIHTRPYTDIYFMENLPEAYLPILWLNESAHATPKVVRDFKNMIKTPLTITTVVEFTLLAVGLLLIIIMTSLLVKRWKDKRSSNLLINSHPDSSTPLLQDA